MFFDTFIKNLPAEPAFSFFYINDVNEVSGQKKKRKIGNPNAAMRIVHAEFRQYLRFFASMNMDLSYATGALPYCSSLKNIWQHCGHRYFYWMDLKNAYSNVDGKLLAQAVAAINPHEDGKEIYGFLTKYFLIEGGGLIVGGPASPDLFNIYCAYLIDHKMGELCNQYGIKYTRYLDDLLFSSNLVIGDRKRRAIRQIIIGAGLLINHRKTRVYDLQKGSVAINGIGLRHGGETFLPRHYVRKLRGMLHLAQTGKLDEKEEQKLNGMIGVFTSLFPRKKYLLNLNRTEQKLLGQIWKFRHEPAVIRGIAWRSDLPQHHLRRLRDTLFFAKEGRLNKKQKQKLNCIVGVLNLVVSHKESRSLLRVSGCPESSRFNMTEQELLDQIKIFQRSIGI